MVRVKHLLCYRLLSQQVGDELPGTIAGGHRRDALVLQAAAFYEAGHSWEEAVPLSF